MASKKYTNRNSPYYRIYYRDPYGKFAPKDQRISSDLRDAPKPSQPSRPSATNVGVNINGNATIGGDAVGRDKIVFQQVVDRLKNIEAGLYDRLGQVHYRHMLDSEIDKLRKTYRPPIPLQGIKFSGVPLSGIKLQDADLTGAELAGCDLTQANLRNTNLERADLTGAILVKADLRNASLRRAILTRAKLNEANLEFANLVNAVLESSILRDANLYEANLTCAKVPGADFRGATLLQAKLYLIVDDADTKLSR